MLLENFSLDLEATLFVLKIVQIQLSGFAVHLATSRRQVGVVSGSGIADRSGASCEHVTQIISQLLDLVLVHVRIIPKHPVLGRP